MPLDGHGRGQAMVLASQLRGTPLDAAVSSDLSRCTETARIILSEHPSVKLRLDSDLREMAFGEWEGLTWAEIVRKNPKLALDGWSRPKMQAPPGGERFEDVVARAGRAVRNIREALPEGGRVLVVTHAGVLHALLRVVLGEQEAENGDIRFVPAGITRFALDGAERGAVLSLNVTAQTDAWDR